MTGQSGGGGGTIGTNATRFGSILAQPPSHPVNLTDPGQWRLARFWDTAPTDTLTYAETVFMAQNALLNGNVEITGTLTTDSGTNTSTTAVASAPVFVSTVAQQLSATQDVFLYLAIQTSAALAVAIGPTSTPATTVMPSQTYPLGLVSLRIPAGWWVKITGTIADLTITQVPC